MADITGAPHYVRAVNDYARPGEPDKEYFAWPASHTALDWEREQWATFVEWNARTPTLSRTHRRGLDRNLVC